MTTFADLGLGPSSSTPSRPRASTNPSPSRHATIDDALAGRDVCGKAQDRLGQDARVRPARCCRPSKPARPGHPTALVLVPTRELAKQVVDVLQPLGKAVGMRVAAFYGGTSMDRQIRNLRRRIEVAVATPGRLIDLLERGELDLDAGRAPRRSTKPTAWPTWASCRRSSGSCARCPTTARRCCSPRRSTARSTCSCAATCATRCATRSCPRRKTVDEMTHRFLKVHELDRVKVLAAIAGGVSRTMVFVRTKRGADRLVSQLKREGVVAGAIHGDLRQTRAREGAAGLPGRTSTACSSRPTSPPAASTSTTSTWSCTSIRPKSRRATSTAPAAPPAPGDEGIVVTFVLWDQELEVEQLQTRLGMREPIIEVFSNDPRLADLGVDSTARHRASQGRNASLTRR